MHLRLAPSSQNTHEGISMNYSTSLNQCHHNGQSNRRNQRLLPDVVAPIVVRRSVGRWSR